MSHLTFIMWACLATRAAGVREQRIHFHTDDILALDLAEEVDYHTPLNDLNGDYDHDKLTLELPFPDALGTPPVAPSLTELGVAEVRQALTADEALFALFRSETGSHVLRLEREPETPRLQFRAAKFSVEGAGSVCNGLSVRNGQALTVCLEGNSLLKFCTTSVVSQGGAQCSYFFKEFKLVPEDAERFDFRVAASAPGEPAADLLYFSRAKTPGLRSTFLAILPSGNKILELPDKTLTIDSIVVMSSSAKKMSLLVGVAAKGQKDIYSLDLVDEIVDEKSWKLVKAGTLEFFYGRGRLVAAEKVDRALRVTIGSKDGAVKTMPLPDAARVLPGAVSAQFIALPFLDAADRLTVFLYHFAADAFFLLAAPAAPPGLTRLLDLAHRGLLLHLAADGSALFAAPLKSFQNAYVRMKVKAPAEARLELRVKERPVAVYHLHIDEFNAIDMKIEPVPVAGGDEADFFRLEMRGNNLRASDDSLLLFAPLSLKPAVELFNICQPRTMAAGDTHLIFFCEDGMLLLVDEFVVAERQFLPLRQAVFPPRGLLPKFAQLVDIKVSFDDTVILLFKDGELGILSLRQMKLDRAYKVAITDELRVNYTQCRFNNQGVLCSLGDQAVFLYIQVDDALEKITFTKHVETPPHLIARNVFNSYFDRHFFVALTRDPALGLPELVGYDAEATRLFVDAFPLALDDAAHVKPVAHQAFLVLAQTQDELKMFAVVDQSPLAMPTAGYLKDFARLVETTAVGKDNLFAVAYETKAGELRGAVYRATFDVARRLVAEFPLGVAACDDRVFKLRQLLQGDTLLYFVCRSSEQWDLKMWQVEPDGPFLRYPPHTSQKQFVINDMLFTVQFEVPAYDDKVKALSTKELYLTPSKTDPPLAAIEPNFVGVGGDLKRLVLQGSDAAAAVGRLRRVRADELLSDSSLKVSDTVVSVAYFGDRAVATYKNRMATRDKKTTFQYAACQVAQVVHADADEPRPFYLCRSDKPFRYALTDDDKLTLELDESVIENSLQTGEVFLVDNTNQLTLFFQFRGTKVFKLITIAVVEDSLRVLSHRTFSLDDFSTEGRSIQSYHLLYRKAGARLVMLFVPHATTFLLLKEMSLEDRNFALDFQRVDFAALPKDAFKERAVFASAFFSAGPDQLSVFLAGKVYLYAYRLARDKDGWAAELQAEILNPLGNPVEGARLVGSADHLLLLRARAPADVNVMLYDLKTRALLQALGEPEIGLAQYFVQALSFHKSKDGSAAARLFLLTEPSESLAFTKLVELEFELGPLALSFGRRIKDSQRVRLVAQFLDGTEQTSEVGLFLHRPQFGYLKYFLVLLLLCAVLALTGYFALKMMRENKLRARETESTRPLN